MMMITQSDVNTYNRDGVLRVENIFTKSEINRLRAIATVELTKGHPVEIINDYPTIMYEPDIQDIYSDRVSEVVSKFGDYKRIMNQYYFHLPGDPDTFNWHTDNRFRPEVDQYIQTAILVDRWTPVNGAVEFVLGSHKQDFDNQELRGIKGQKNAKMLIANAGDVLLWSGNIVHASKRNESDTPRAYYMQGFQC